MGKIEEIREWNMENNQKYADRHHYLYLVKSDPEGATNELINEAVGLVDDCEANKAFDAKDVMTRRTWYSFIVLGAMLLVLPLCWVAETLATKVFSCAPCSAEYWSVYVAVFLLLGCTWAPVWLRIMEKIKDSVMNHRIRRLNTWTKKAAKAVVLEDYLDEAFDLGDFTEI